MIKREFIKRQLEELGRAISKVITEMQKFKELGKVDEAFGIAQETLKNTFDFDIENILCIPDDKFIEIVIKDEKFSAAHLNYMGDLLYATAELFIQKRETEKAKILFQKVLSVFHFVDNNEKTFSLERNNKIESIENYFGIIN